MSLHLDKGVTLLDVRTNPFVHLSVFYEVAC